MSVAYKNRKGLTYYLCQSTTKTGKPRYYFSRKCQGTSPRQIPEGYHIQESVNGVVSLAKRRAMAIADSEIQSVTAAVRAHPKREQYRVDIKSTDITIYERVGPDLADLAAALGLGKLNKDAIRRLEERERLRSRFTPMMRFRLSDKVRRLFTAQRMCFMGGIDDWITIEYEKPIATLSRELIPVLGTDEFFELA